MALIKYYKKYYVAPYQKMKYNICIKCRIILYYPVLMFTHDKTTCALFALRIEGMIFWTHKYGEYMLGKVRNRFRKWQQQETIICTQSTLKIVHKLQK